MPFKLLTAHNWQNWKEHSPHVTVVKIYRAEAIGLKSEKKKKKSLIKAWILKFKS